MGPAEKIALEELDRALAGQIVHVDETDLQSLARIIRGLLIQFGRARGFPERLLESFAQMAINRRIVASGRNVDQFWRIQHDW